MGLTHFWRGIGGHGQQSVRLTRWPQKRTLLPNGAAVASLPDNF